MQNRERREVGRPQERVRARELPDTTYRLVQFDAFRAGKVDQQARGKLPIPVSSMLDGGPTVDFILGRIFESAMQDTSRQLFEASNNTETRKIIAGQTFAKRNCELL
jgi:hypothetical protein